MDTFIYITAACLFLMVCGLIHELLKCKNDILDLEEELTRVKIESKGGLARLDAKLSFFARCKTDEEAENGLR